MARFYWDPESKKVVSEAERFRHGGPDDTSRRSTPAISVFKAGFNPSLGAYCGSRRDVAEACRKIEDRTGSRPIEIGDQHVKHSPDLTPYEMPRDALR